MPSYVSFPRIPDHLPGEKPKKVPPKPQGPLSMVQGINLHDYEAKKGTNKQENKGGAHGKEAESKGAAGVQAGYHWDWWAQH